jgi:flagellar export protein FliJ
MPKKFRFRLEKVLTFRERVKDEKEVVLKNALTLLNQARDELVQLEGELNTYSSKIETSTSSDLLLIGMYLGGLKTKISTKVEQVQEREAAAEEAQKEYIEARREVKTLDALKEKKQFQYNEKLEHEAGKQLDEFATQRSSKS